MPPLPNRPKPLGIGAPAPIGSHRVGVSIPPRKASPPSKWAEGEFRVTFDGETTEEKGSILGPFGVYSEDGEDDGKPWTRHRLIHLPSEHPICSFLSRDYAVKMGEYLHANYLAVFMGSDRQKIKEHFDGTWFKAWMVQCHKTDLWHDPVEFKKGYDNPPSAPVDPIRDEEQEEVPVPRAIKPKGLTLGVKVS